MSIFRSFSRTTRRARSVFLTNDFDGTTWLAVGAALQLMALSILPRWLSISPTIVFLSQRLFRTLRETRRLAYTTFPDILSGRRTARAPADKEGVSLAPDGVVMFVPGARINHPLGRLAAGAPEVFSMFLNMWREAEHNRSRWGNLGRTDSLINVREEHGLTFIWLSYWKDSEGLLNFATSGAHQIGHDAYLAKKFPHVDIMHETFHAPAGSWETIYHNFPPFGLGSARFVLETDNNSSESFDPLAKATGSQMRSMFARMGRAE